VSEDRAVTRVLRVRVFRHCRLIGALCIIARGATVNERKRTEAVAAEIESASALEQLAPIARRISAEALSAELAAERGDWETVHATYERLALLFAEYRLRYVQCLTAP
jgi:hypothetical protein